MARAAIGLVGKLPASADFLRVRAQSEAYQSLLAWLVDGVQSAASRGEGYADADAGVQALCYRSRKGTTVLGGALAPSLDQAGRRFPIAAASELALDTELSRHPEALPLILEPLWAVCSQLAIELQGVDRAALDAVDLHADVDVDLPAALGAYRRWVSELELDDFVELVFDGDRAQAAGAFALTEEAVAPYVGVENPDTPLALRLPLGRAGGAAVCFWLDLIVRVTGWRRTVPSFFWSHDGASGALLLHLGRVPAAALSELWLPSGSSDAVCDLVAPECSFRSTRASRWERIVGDPDQAVSELLAAAAAKSPRRT